MARSRESPEQRAARFAPVAMKYDAPWRRVLIRWLPQGMTLTEVHERLGWTKGQAYWRRRLQNLPLRVAAQMAQAVGAPLGRFLEEVAKEEGIPALYTRVVQKPRAQERSLKALGRFVRCSACKELGHRKGSPKCHGETPSPEMLLARAQAVANPIRRVNRGPPRSE
jgi:hypothetical protein